MIGQNIKYYRKKRGMSQGEMAVKLHVVRQTVSKWENGLSVPDAKMLIDISNLLGVSINVLLGISETNFHDDSLSKELEKVTQILAEKKQKEKLLKEASKKRSLIVFLSFISLTVMVIIKNQSVSIILLGICVLSSAFILYRNLALLTLTTNNSKLGILRFITIFNITAVILVFLLSLLIELDFIVITEHSEKIVALFIVTGIMLFSGIICPRLPYNRHTGLRLPWTVADEDTWNVAHQLVGYTAFPIVLLYVAAAFSFDDFEMVTACAIACWTGIPVLLSLVYFCKKEKGSI